eukprot:427624_1
MSGLSPMVASVISTPASIVFRRGDPKQFDSISSITSTELLKDETGITKFGGYIALIGGLLAQLTFGSLFCYGNLSIYIASYMTHNEYISSDNPNNFDISSTYNNYISQTNWVLFIIVTFMSIFIIFGGNLEVTIGPTKTLFIASLLVTIGMSCTYFSLIYNSQLLLILTYGIIFGSGVGIGYPVLVIVCMRWFPEKRGLICGIISAIFGSGAFVFDTIQTELVNPT